MQKPFKIIAGIKGIIVLGFIVFSGNSLDDNLMSAGIISLGMFLINLLIGAIVAFRSPSIGYPLS